MALHRGYEPANGCSSGSTSGAKALQSWFVGAYGNKSPKGANLGIYNCKRLGSGWSVHAEGRAVDLGTAPYSEPGWGWALANALRSKSKELGIQLIIFDRKIWSGSQPDAGWRDYGGSNPHGGHLHVELTRVAARTLTASKIQNTLIPSAPSPKPPTGIPKITNGTRVLRLTDPMMRGTDVLYVQKWIGPKRAGKADGIFGPNTRAGVIWYQRIRSIGTDGIVGRITWGNMRVKWRG